MSLQRVDYLMAWYWFTIDPWVIYDIGYLQSVRTMREAGQSGVVKTVYIFSCRVSQRKRSRVLPLNALHNVIMSVFQIFTLRTIPLVSATKALSTICSQLLVTGSTDSTEHTYSQSMGYAFHISRYPAIISLFLMTGNRFASILRWCHGALGITIPEASRGG